MKTYKHPITKLEPNQIFVFGSNTQGRHGKGAAKWALLNAGAKYGQAQGLQGQSYAIVTKDLTKSIHPSITPYLIYQQIIELYEYAVDQHNKEFLIAYFTQPNLNGYTPKEMSMLFSLCDEIPSNIIFEEEFSKLINHDKSTSS